MRRRQGTIKDWIIYSKSKGIDLSYLDSDKNLDLQKLAGSGLPIFDLFSCSYSSFLANDPKLVDFLFRYSGFVVRAIPKLGENLPRRYKIGITNFQEASSFLEEQARGNEKRYNVALTEWEPAIFSGVVQLAEPNTFVEVGRMGLDNLSHGRGRPFRGIFYNSGVNRFRLYDFQTLNNRKGDYSIAANLMRKVLLYFDRQRFGIAGGYFEFVLTRSNQIKFIDFKDNSAYLV